MNVRQELRRLQAPDEAGVQARAWEVVSSTYRARAARARRAPRWKLAVAPALTAAALAVVLTPAGATVSRVISHAVAPPPAQPLLSLPTHGKLLVSGAGGTWIVAPDGTRSRVGSWRDASWSPHARYIVVASRNRLAAVTQGGEIQWELSRPAVSDPTWFAPSGYRVAYRSGSSLRVVAGDGTADHLLATHVAPVTPAWRPDHAYQLAYIRHGQVVLRGADSGRAFWTRPAGSAIKLQWSADGSRLLLLTRRAARVLSGSGQTETTIKFGAANRLIGGSIAPDGKEVALVRSQGVQIVRLAAATIGRGAVACQFAARRRDRRRGLVAEQPVAAGQLADRERMGVPRNRPKATSESNGTDRTTIRPTNNQPASPPIKEHRASRARRLVLHRRHRNDLASTLTGVPEDPRQPPRAFLMSKGSIKVIREATGTAAAVALLMLALPDHHNALGAVGSAKPSTEAAPRPLTSGDLVRAGWQDRQADRQRLVVRTPARDLRLRLCAGFSQSPLRWRV